MSVLSRAALFEQTILDAARKERVDPKILWTIAYNETRFRPWLTSPKNAQGLMQFIPATAVRFGLENPYEPKASIHAAARYVKYLGSYLTGVSTRFLLLTTRVKAQFSPICTETLFVQKES